MDRLIALGDEARPYLHRRLADEAVQNEVALALGDVGDEATVPLLIDAYPTADVSGELGFSSLDASDTRLKIICFTRALNRLTGAAIGETRWGVDCDPGNRDRWAAAVASALLGEDAGPALPELATATRDPDPEVRFEALSAIADIGPGAEAAVPDLVAAQRDEEWLVRHNAAEALQRIAPGSAIRAGAR
jgi:HEAT repeat protein